MFLARLAFVLTAGFPGVFFVTYGQTTEGYAKAIKATPLMRTSVTASGQPIVYPKTDQPEVSAFMVEIPPGAETGWHKHPWPCYAYVLSGNLRVEFEGGEAHDVKPGEALAESVNVLHNGHNTGTEPVKLVLFVTGEKGQPFTVKAPKPPEN